MVFSSVASHSVRGDVALSPAITGHMFNPSLAGTSPLLESFGSTPARLLKVAYLLHQEGRQNQYVISWAIIMLHEGAAYQSQMCISAFVVLPRIFDGR